MHNLNVEATTTNSAALASHSDGSFDKLVGKDDYNSAASSAGDKLRADAGTKCMTLSGDLLKGGCSASDALLPSVTIDGAPSNQSSDIRLNSGLMPVHKFPDGHDFKSGDYIKFVGREQNLHLADGQHIAIGPKGQIQMYDGDGKPVTVVSREPAPDDIMPQVDRVTMSNGAIISQSANITMIHFTDGTTVGLDQDGLKAIDRPDRPRLQLQPELGDFTFHGYK